MHCYEPVLGDDIEMVTMDDYSVTSEVVTNLKRYNFRKNGYGTTHAKIFQ